MYIWTGPGFRSPALLFYAGPTYFEGEDDISSAETGTEVSIAQLKVTLYQTYLVCLVVATNVHLNGAGAQLCNTTFEGGLSNNVTTTCITIDMCMMRSVETSLTCTGLLCGDSGGQ